jgi:hypothetical protein
LGWTGAGVGPPPPPLPRSQVQQCKLEMERRDGERLKRMEQETKERHASNTVKRIKADQVGRRARGGACHADLGHRTCAAGRWLGWRLACTKTRAGGSGPSLGFSLGSELPATANTRVETKKPVY